MNGMDIGELTGLVVWATGAVMWAMGYLWILVYIFRESYGWGLLCLGIPPLVYLYGLLNWTEVERQTVILTVSLIIALLGGGLVKYEAGLDNQWELLIPLPVTVSYLRGP